LQHQKNFPIVNALQSNVRIFDAFIVGFNSSDNVFVSTLFGGNNVDIGSSIAISPDDPTFRTVIIAGTTDSRDFPVFNYDQGISGSVETFISKIHFNCSIIQNWSYNPVSSSFSSFSSTSSQDNSKVILSTWWIVAICVITGIVILFSAIAFAIWKLGKEKYEKAPKFEELEELEELEEEEMKEKVVVEIEKIEDE